MLTKNLKAQLLKNSKVLLAIYSKNGKGLLKVAFESVPMSFADACLVRMSERIANSAVMTLVCVKLKLDENLGDRLSKKSCKMSLD